MVRSMTHLRRPKGAARSGESADHSLGHSRAGLSTKVHLAADGCAQSLVFTGTAGQAGDAPAFETVMFCIRACRTGLGRRQALDPARGGSGRPRVCLAPSVAACGFEVSVRSSRSRVTESATPAARPTRRPSAPFGSEVYRQRNTVERCINCLKQWRGLATRADKLAIAFQAALHLAGILSRTRR